MMATETIISLCIAGLSLLFVIISQWRTNKQDISADTEQRVNMSADIRYIRNSVDDIKLENKAIQKDIVGIRERLVTVESSVKSAHERLDILGGSRNNV